MDTSLEGTDTSLWIGTTPRTSYPELEHDDTVYDLLIVGGGITGIAAAYYAQQRGLKTALIEKRRIVEWTTGGTTAKLSSQHYLIYDYLLEHHGEDAARAFAEANQHGIEEIERLSRTLGIESDFSRRNSYVYTLQKDKIEAMQREVAAAQKLGLPASFETTTELPLEIKGAIKFENQAQFHPRKFLLGLATTFVQNGGILYETTKATDIEPGDITTVKTNKGDLKAKNVLQASGKPFWRSDILDDRMWEKVSYALAVKLKPGANYPTGMYITTDTPMRTIRSADYDGGQVLIFGGESHQYDEASFDPDTHYKRLIAEVHENYEVDEVLFRWLASDFMPYDRIPFIGPDPKHPSIYVATGYRAWGLAWAMSATQSIVNYIEGQPDDWSKHFSLDRLGTPLADKEKVHGIN